METGTYRNGKPSIQIVNKKFIDEGNLYRLIIKSKLKNSKKFEKWMFEQVLPIIRKHDAYMNDNVLEKVLDDPNFLSKLIEKLTNEKMKRCEAERKVDVLKGNIIANKPHVDFSKTISNTDGAISIGSFAKLLNNNHMKIGRNRLYYWFSENGDKLRITPLIIGKGHIHFMKIIEEDFILG